MPSKKSKQSKQKNRKEAADWKINEDIEVLAWADHNLQIDPTGKKFRESVENHLRESCQVDYTLSQIRTRLNWFWKEYGREGVSEKPNLINREGSRCLERPTFVWHEEIAGRRAALETIAHDQPVEQLSLRTTRSASRFGSRGLRRSRSTLDCELVGSPSPRKKARIRSVPQSPCPKIETRTVDKQCIQEASTVASLSKRERWHTPPDTPRRQCTIRDSFELDSGSEHEHDRSRRFLPLYQSVILSPKPSSKVEATSCPSTRQPSREPRLANASNQKGFVFEKKQTEYHLEEHSRTQEENHEAEIAFYSMQLKAKEEEAKACKDQLESLKSAQQASSNGFDLVQLLADSRSKVKTLQKTLADRNLHKTFSSLASTEPVSCDKGFVGSEMNRMGGEINGLARLDDTQVCDFSTIAETLDLAPLIIRAFPCADPPIGSLSLMNRIPQALKLNEVVRTLVGAAVCCWVFDSPLEFLHTSSPCRLLSQYRICLEIQDGPEALRNLDFAAHMRLLEEGFFQKRVVLTEARRLTTMLCEVLRPLFAQQELMGLVPQSSLYKPTEAGQDDVNRLQKIFESALQVKARLVLSTNVFEAVMYAPGTPFSRTRMNPRNSRGMLVEIVPRWRPEILCCYLPALIEHEKIRHLVDHNNFIQSVPAEQSQLKPFSQAVVLL